MCAAALANRFAPRASALLATSLLLWGCSQHLDAQEMAESAASWRPGDAIPGELLAYRPRSACVYLPSDSAIVIGGIDNLPLLLALASSADAPDETIELALERALLLAGPQRVFSALEQLYRARPGYASDPRYTAIAARAREPQVWLDAVYVNTSELAANEAEALLAHLAERVRGGETFEDVTRDASTGPASASPLTGRPLVGNLGDFVVSASKRDAAPYRYAEVPAEHVPALLAARDDELLVLRDAGRRNTADGGGERIVLYRVRQRYMPAD